MSLSNFFTIALVIQLLVGTGLFAVSMLIEYQVLQAFLLTPAIAFTLAMMLEGGKATAIIWHRFLLSQPQSYPETTRTASAFFRIGLLLLSLLCSLLFLANHLDRPNLQVVRSADLEEVEQRLQQELVRIEQNSQQQIERLHEQDRKAQATLLQSHQQQLEKLQQQRNAEMDNVVRGQFKGPRYRELERQIEKERDSYLYARKSLSENQAQKIDKLIERLEAQANVRRTEVVTQAQKERDRIAKNDYANDERVNDPYIVAFTSLSRALLPGEIAPMQFVFGFALLLSLLIEIGIILAFDTVTVTLLPALKTQHQEQIETEIIKTQADATARQTDIRHRSRLESILDAYERTVAQAEKAQSKTRQDKLAESDS